MGNTCTCFESGRWDAHTEVNSNYPEETEVYQDMTQPLPHYFISSGHNSYLTGDQLFASAGTSTIVKSLKAGCRVVELDVYNGPICKHGGTFTSPVSFQECIEAIASAAFVASPYPVIITMENHTDVENQGKMAAILRSVLGDLLFLPDPTDSRREYLSPAQLINKVVCRTSVKKSCEYHPDFVSLIYIRNTKCSSLQDMIKREDVVSSSFEETALPQADELDPEEDTAAAQKAAKQRAQLAASRPRDWQALQQAGPGAFGEAPEDAVTASELNAAGTGGHPVAGSLQELYAYTSRHLARVYPAGWRVTSGNYNPMRAWVRGASLAALNWQVWDKALWANEARFMDNGGCGYVLKPEWMRCPQQTPPQLPPRTPRRLVVRVHSAHKYQGNNCCIFKDDLFVKINVWGMPCDRAAQKSRTAHDTGRLRVEHDFVFSVRYPEMALLCITLKDDDAGGIGGAVGRAVADSLGYFSLPLSRLVEGEYKLRLKCPRSGIPLDGKDNWVKVGLRWEQQPDKEGKEGGGKDERVEGKGAEVEAEGVVNPAYAGPGA
ncbi:hypothetical protein PLESTB_000962700 [Pleodorina starrii]|uniref:Phosphoinositide phospholipase C n=1 Tax=Pleodorina starrii TaxID=330485 RepID=A0A9W6BPN9_9CHLO|nr:hypothetical protein PLESTM_001135300 [Pleodorina starrii]GLC55236.1 hypothetical protein PLESTB_000962700 [Pleodorina starrii]GLC71007.1 hypothetical protein PLESTF_001060300 [Pleodorina starrii]